MLAACAIAVPAPMLRRDRLREGPAGLELAAGNDYLGTVLHHGFRDGTANAARRAGDNSNFAAELEEAH